jgi:rare lipoprotein A (peptidoglycan hydrolase)
MPRSTLRRALRAGALCLTATTTAAVVPAVADAAQFSIAGKRMNIHSGSRVTVKGRAVLPGTVKLQVRRHHRGKTLDRAHIRARGRFVLHKRLHRPRSYRARLRISTGAKRRIGRINVYRRAHASWYGPGLYGNHLGCGGRLHVGSVGVANKTLPCGSKVTLRHRGRVLRVRVIDRGPYVGGREYDLTAATARRLRFSGHGPIQVTR